MSGVVKNVTNAVKSALGQDTEEEEKAKSAAKVAAAEQAAAEASAAEEAAKQQNLQAALDAYQGPDIDAIRADVERQVKAYREAESRASQTRLKNEAEAKKRSLDTQADIVAKRNEQADADTKRMRRRTTRQTAFSGGSSSLGEAQTARRSAFATTLGS